MKKITFLLSFFLLLTSCMSSPVSATESKSATPAYVLTTTTEEATSDLISTPTDIVDSLPQCLLPIREFEYPIGDAPFDWSEIDDLLPSQEWQRVTNVPDALQLVLSQSRNTETELWIYKKTGGIVRYRFINNQWNAGALLNGPAEGLGSFGFFLDRENNVWAARLNKLGSRIEFPKPLLSRYNEQTNQFEPIDLSLDNQDALGIRHIVVDQQGIFWFLAIDQGKYQLYSLDPSTMTTKRHLADYVLYPPFAISRDTMFILAADSESNPSPEYILIQYALDTEAVITYWIPWQFYGYGGRYEPGMLPSTLFVDSRHRVWLGARGWIDLSSENTHEWHIVIPDPVFIDVQPGSGLWGWNEPQITYETPDGQLWYSALRGTGWVDPQLGEWCVFTSYQSNVFADGRGSLWILVDGWLYRRE